MCTAIVDVDPSSAVPVLLAGIRDEFHDRSWVGPGRHWPREYPGVVGGQDLLASGTWLAADPPAVRAATVLNGWGVLAPQSARLSRGDLALRFAAGGAEAVADLPLARYDPFLLVCATVEEVFLLSWDGRRPARRVLGPGLHLVVNSGLEGADSDEGPGVEQMAARIKYFRPQLAAAPRPEPVGGVSTRQAWGPWLPLVDGAGLDSSDERALLVRRPLGERTWGTTSVSLVGLRRDGLRYDFNAEPGDPDGWTAVVDD
ncbi:NRDE family protein [Catenulispora yoronensis]|uniref:NRDE family protein n=1 Tax=Catenulispora yoronensis TaxID=450799 RepID=A0ABP5F4V0_9ACTN